MTPSPRRTAIQAPAARPPDMTDAGSSSPRPDRRLPPSRVSPEAMAAARGGAVEGLAWLGRPPEAGASLLYRMLRLVARFTIFVVFRFRIRTSGQEQLPKGGYLLARSAKQITIAQILESIEGPLGITDCSHEKDGEFCMQREHCNIRTPLLKVQDSIHQLLNNMTLQDMMGGTPLITIQSPTAQGVER